MCRNSLASLLGPSLSKRNAGVTPKVTTSHKLSSSPPKSLAAAAKRLDLYQDFDRDRVLSTAGHEAMPGHYLQFSIARRHPDFVRKTSGSGVFSEGWAYYGEEMLMQLGLYGEDLDGRLDIAQWERIRGARAIVDAKLASGLWSYRRAADFFAQETGGRHLSFETLKGLEETIARAGEDIHSQYLLSFVPASSKGGGFRRLEVTVPSRPDAVVRARPGYWADR